LSFIIDFFYEIQGRDKLFKNTNLTLEQRKIIGKSTIFKHQSHKRLTYSQADYQILAKTLFLIRLNQLYNYEFIKTNTISTDFFDKWWKIRKIPQNFEAKNIINLSDDILSKIDVKNDYTINYLENFK
jgi:hypothetical protein